MIMIMIMIMMLILLLLLLLLLLIIISIMILLMIHNNKTVTHSQQKAIATRHGQTLKGLRAAWVFHLQSYFDVKGVFASGLPQKQ